MAFSTLLLDYLAWHFSPGLIDFWKVWADLVYFIYHFFAIPIHLKSVFKPLYRLNDTNAEFGIWPYVELKLYNIIMRLVGFVFRAVTLIIGLVCILLHLIFGVFLFVVWFFLPPVILILFVYGFKLLLTI